MDTKYVWNMATGGITHMLYHMAGSLEFCKLNDALLLPITKHHGAFELKFDEVFDVSDSKYISCSNFDFAHASFLWNENCPYLNADLFSLRTFYYTPPDGTGGRYLLKDFPVVGEDTRYLEKMQASFGGVTVTVGNKIGGLDSLKNLLSELKLSEFCVQVASTLCLTLPKQYIGCHFRNTDHSNDIDEVAKLISKACADYSINDLYFATDDLLSVAYIKGLLPNLRVHSNPSLLYDVKSTGSKNLHYITDEKLRSVGSSKLLHHASFFADVFALSKANFFIPSKKSSVKYLVELFATNPTLVREFYKTSKVVSQ